MNWSLIGCAVLAAPVAFFSPSAPFERAIRTRRLRRGRATCFGLSQKKFGKQVQNEFFNARLAFVDLQLLIVSL